jgi:hypothetical protein
MEMNYEMYSFSTNFKRNVASEVLTAVVMNAAIFCDSAV